MIAGSGIIPQEMPRPKEGDFRGLQLWVNLPKGHKMVRPRYRGMEAAQIPGYRLPDGITAKIIAGAYEGRRERSRISSAAGSTSMSLSRQGASSTIA